MTSSNYIQEISSVVNKWNNRLSWDELFMINALTLSARSSCDRLHVGCVLVKDKKAKKMSSLEDVLKLKDSQI